MPRARRTTSDLARLLGHATAPVYLVDELRQMVYCNAACAQWAGINVDELLGQTCVYSAAESNAGAPQPRAAAGLCPPPAAFAGQRVRGIVSSTGQGGLLRQRAGDFIPLSGEVGADSSVLVVLSESDLSDGASETAETALDPADRLHQQLQHFLANEAKQHGVEKILGRGPLMQRIRAQAGLASKTDDSVLIIGERGTGKQHVARAIYHGGEAGVAPRSWISLDCELLSTETVESSLQALASRQRDAAQSVTLLLRNVASLSPAGQAALLRLLDARPSGLRTIACSSVPIFPAVAEGRFSGELLLRLSTLTIELPPLRARPEDLPLLAQWFVERQNALAGKQLSGLSGETLEALVLHPLPGNLADLAALIAEAHDRASGSQIALGDLPPRVSLASDAARYATPREDAIVLEDFLARIERELIERALRRASGNKTKAARLLGMTRPRFYRRLVQLGLITAEEIDFRESD